MNGLRLDVRATSRSRPRSIEWRHSWSQLRELGMGLWVQESGAAGRYDLILSHYSPGHVADVEEFLRLLELKGDPARESAIRIAVALGVRDGSFDGLAVQTRSIAQSCAPWRRRSRCLPSMSPPAS